MTRAANLPRRWAWLMAVLVVLGFGMDAPRAVAAAAGMQLEAQLVWGTQDAKSPDPSHKPVSPEILEKLKELPLKWTHYFEVNRQGFGLEANALKKIGLSDKCQLEVKDFGDGRVEVALVGKGERVVKRTQKLPKGEILVLGGNAPNSTAWLVILKRVR